MRVAAVLQIIDICKGGFDVTGMYGSVRENFKQYSEQWVTDNYVPKTVPIFLLILMTIFLWETLLKLKPIEKQESTGTGNFGISVDFIFRLLQ